MSGKGVCSVEAAELEADLGAHWDAGGMYSSVGRAMPPVSMQGNEWSRETGAAVQAGSGRLLQGEVSVGGTHAVSTPSTGRHASSPMMCQVQGTSML